jgi:hypothetical protein
VRLSSEPMRLRTMNTFQKLESLTSGSTNGNVNILAIDPGPESSAWVCYNPTEQFLYGKNIQPNMDVLRMLAEWDHEFTEPAHLVIEQVASFGMPVGAEVFETVFWSGRFAQAFGGSFSRVKRHEVKMHLCQNMRAKDGNIRQALLDKFGPAGTKKAPGKLYGVRKDLWSALAVAVTFAEFSLPAMPKV